MNTRLIASALFVWFALILCGPAEIVQNGDFKNDLNYWEVSRHNGYTPSPDVEVKDGALEFSRLMKLSGPYLSLKQSLDIKKGVRYKLTYEVKGPAESEYSLFIGDIGYRLAKVKPVWHYHQRKSTAANESWEKVEAEFEGQFDTDQKWHSKMVKLTKENVLKKGRTPGIRPDDRPSVDMDDIPCRSPLFFYLGGLKGEFAIRNVSVVEIGGGAGSAPQPAKPFRY